MPEFLEPRVVRLSWRPSDDRAGAEVADWVERLKKRLKVFRVDRQRRPIQLVDLREPGLDRAAAREGPWTDFVALFTVDYCLGCDSEGETSELHEALLREREPGHLLWLVRLEEGDPADVYIGERQPWAPGCRWQLLPPDPAVVLSRDPARIDSDIQNHCVEPLRSPPSPRTDPP